MDLDDFRALTEGGSVPMIRVGTFLKYGQPRMGTLLYGYTCQMRDRDRADFHVYLKDGMIHRLLYREHTHRIEIVEYDAFHAWDAERLVPDKRVYPESTTVLMARLLKEAGVDVAYTRYSTERYDRVRDETFHALIREDIPG